MDSLSVLYSLQLVEALWIVSSLKKALNVENITSIFLLKSCPPPPLALLFPVFSSVLLNLQSEQSQHLYPQSFAPTWTNNTPHRWRHTHHFNMTILQ